MSRSASGGPGGAARLAFQLAADAAYLRMTTAMVNAIAHYHPDCPIRIYVPDADRRAFAALEPRAELRSPPDHRLNHGAFHPLIWTKMEAALADEEAVVVLDPDQILYRPLDALVATFLASGADFGASVDNETVAAQFKRLPDVLAPHAERAGLSSGTMIVRPSQAMYDAYLDAARRFAADARYPDQAVLNILAYVEGRWQPFGDELQLLHLSPAILDPEHGSCLVHLYTPRPDWCGPSPRRPNEPCFAEACVEFEAETGHPYPEARLRADFLARLEDRWTA